MTTSIARRGRIQEQADELYDTLYAQEEDRQRGEWLAQFGVSALFPFKPDGNAIHTTVMRQMDAMREDD